MSYITPIDVWVVKFQLDYIEIRTSSRVIERRRFLLQIILRVIVSTDG